MAEPSALDRAYADYRSRPTPERLNAVVRFLRPTIDSAVNMTGVADDPVMRQQAKLFAARAISTYDPQRGAGLPTWVSTQLQELRRYKRSYRSPLKLPERIQLDAFAIDKATREIVDETGKEPDLLQLSDRLAMPIKRIRKVRETFRRTPASLEGAGGDEAAASGGAGATEIETDFSGEALDYVYLDADPVDRKIIELMTGYGGNQPITPKEAALKLNLTPSQLSRRRAKLALKTQDTERSLQRMGSAG